MVEIELFCNWSILQKREDKVLDKVFGAYDNHSETQVVSKLKRKAEVL